MIDKATKIFPCDCMGEGTTVTVEEDIDYFDCDGAPFVGLAFWEIQVKLGDYGGLHLRRWDRIKYAWRILRGHSPWTDMVWMKAKVAQNLANHILYLIGRAKKKQDESKMLVKPEGSNTKWPENEVIKETEESSLDTANIEFNVAELEAEGKIVIEGEDDN